MRSEHNPDARRSPKGFVWMLMRKVELDGDSTSILFTNRRRRLQSDVLDGDQRHGDNSDGDKRNGDKRKVAKRA